MSHDPSQLRFMDVYSYFWGSWRGLGNQYMWLKARKWSLPLVLSPMYKNEAAFHGHYNPTIIAHPSGVAKTTIIMQKQRSNSMSPAKPVKYLIKQRQNNVEYYSNESSNNWILHSFWHNYAQYLLFSRDSWDICVLPLLSIDPWIARASHDHALI